MTTPDIEKLRGLLKRRRERESESHMQMPLSVSDEAQSCCCRFCADELEAAGLAELLADYERLLRGRGSKESIALATYLLATKPPEWQYDVVQEKAKRVLGAEQPPAVSEEKQP